MKYQYLFIVFCCSLRTSAQIDTLRFIDGTNMIVDGEKIVSSDLNIGAFKMVERSAEFPGGVSALYKWIDANKKSDATLNDDVTVNALFTINQKGLPTAIVVQGDTADGRANEVKRLFQEMPRWKPASQQGKTVKMRLGLPIKFSKKDTGKK